jgi:hypothetical protein
MLTSHAAISRCGNEYRRSNASLRDGDASHERVFDDLLSARYRRHFMIRIAIMPATLVCATAAHAQTVIEKLCIVTAAQELPRVPGLEIKASRITAGDASERPNEMPRIWRP